MVLATTLAAAEPTCSDQDMGFVFQAPPGWKAQDVEDPTLCEALGTDGELFLVLGVELPEGRIKHSGFVQAHGGLNADFLGPPRSVLWERDGFGGTDQTLVEYGPGTLGTVSHVLFVTNGRRGLAAVEIPGRSTSEALGPALAGFETDFGIVDELGLQLWPIGWFPLYGAVFSLLGFGIREGRGKLALVEAARARAKAEGKRLKPDVVQQWTTEGNRKKWGFGALATCLALAWIALQSWNGVLAAALSFVGVGAGMIGLMLKPGD